jgi:hypothetical protein
MDSVPPSRLAAYLYAQLNCARESGQARQHMLSPEFLQHWRWLQNEIERLERDIDRHPGVIEESLAREVEQVAAEVALLANSARRVPGDASVASSRRMAARHQH